MVQRPTPVISFSIFWKKTYRDATSKKISGLIFPDYYLWNKVKTRLYEDRLNTPFESEEEMISKIKSVWKEWAWNLIEIRKSIKELPSKLRAVKECNGSSIKMHFG